MNIAKFLKQLFLKNICELLLLWFGPPNIRRMPHRLNERNFSLNFDSFLLIYSQISPCLSLLNRVQWIPKLINLVKVGLSGSKKKNLLFAWLKALLKCWKNIFYFVLKAFFVKTYKFLSRHFGHVRKTAWLEKKG